MAAKANAPIVPVGVGGSEQVMPKGSKLIYPRKVHLIVGPPIVVPGADQGRVPRAVLAEVTTTLHDELQRLFDAAEARAGRRDRTGVGSGAPSAERRRGRSGAGEVGAERGDQVGGVVGAAQLPGRVHRQLRAPDVGRWRCPGGRR